MANQSTIEDVFALVFFKFPGRRFKSAEEAGVVTQMWEKLYAPVPDGALKAATERFIARTEKIFPDDDPFSMILNMADPQLLETAGDCQEIVTTAVSRFGMYRADEAMTWIESRSKLVASAVRRIGFLEYCKSEEPEITRGQLRRYFEAEKARAESMGFIVESAADQLNAGRVDQLPGSESSKVLSIVDRISGKLTLSGKKMETA
jgi:hypothetical protein